MAIRTRLELKTSISEIPSSDQRELGNRDYTEITDEMNEGGSWTVKLEAGAADVPIALPLLASAKLLVIRTKASLATEVAVEVFIRINDVANEERSITPMPGGKQGFYANTHAGITSLFASNPGAVDMDITITVAGD